MYLAIQQIQKTGDDWAKINKSVIKQMRHDTECKDKTSTNSEFSNSSNKI